MIYHGRYRVVRVGGVWRCYWQETPRREAK